MDKPTVGQTVEGARRSGGSRQVFPNLYRPSVECGLSYNLHSIIQPKEREDCSNMIMRMKAKVSRVSRDRKLEQFYSFFKNGMTVLDVGVSAESNKNMPTINYFLKNYRYAPETYVGLGIKDLKGMEDKYPGKRFVQYPGGKFPFKDKEFDWVFSNAVIEHAGDHASQLLFINEMLRVADNVFFTTPNKYFPIESHTNAVFMHWNSKIFYRWCSKYKRWINRNSLNLLSFRRLSRLLESSQADFFTISKNRFFGIPMTFSVVCKRNVNMPGE
jgi:hypothetical protein